MNNQNIPKIINWGALSKRLIEEKIVDPIALKIVENQVKPGDTITPKVENGKIII